MFKVMICAYFWLQSGYEVPISLGFLFKVMVLLIFGLKVDFKQHFP